MLAGGAAAAARRRPLDRDPFEGFGFSVVRVT
jgi:hypothetical protein